MKLTWIGDYARTINPELTDVADWHDIWIIDESTGIVYQGMAQEASGDMLQDVQEYLAPT